jgi:DNA replication protein DnaC
MTRTTPNSTLLAEIKTSCKQLHLPTVSARAGELADDARRTTQPYEAYLSALLAAECEDRAERRRRRLVVEAHFPRLKTLEEFRFDDNRAVQPRTIRELATVEFCRRAENVILLGDSGTGKTHLGIALGIAACQASMRVRFTTTAGLVNELIEARDERVLSKVVHRYAAADLLILDELAYVPLQPADAELLFQVIDARTEHGSILVTTNLPFSEWTQVFPETRLCKAVVDRLTFNAHIIETGTESWRFKRTAARRSANKRASS